jgi:uncharacterized protein YndB with AHSA1/START domain
VTGRDAAEDAVTCEAVVPAPPGEVFRWFVEPELLVRWIGIDAQLEPRPGGLFRFEIVSPATCATSNRSWRDGPSRLATDVSAARRCRCRRRG